MKLLFKKALLMGLLGLSLTVLADQGVYQTDNAFVNEAFSGNPPKAKMLWLTGKIKVDTETILGHPYSRLRVKFWRKADRTAWILEEIGKEKPITTGFVVEDDSIQQVKVLAFRETRGWEVKHPFFTNQFRGVRLHQDKSKPYSLDKGIDGITGATLSVVALKKLSRLALYLHQNAEKK